MKYLQVLNNKMDVYEMTDNSTKSTYSDITFSDSFDRLKQMGVTGKPALRIETFFKYGSSCGFCTHLKLILIFDLFLNLNRKIRFK